MKKYLVIFLFALSFNLFCQDYFPINTRLERNYVMVIQNKVVMKIKESVRPSKIPDLSIIVEEIEFGSVNTTYFRKYQASTKKVSLLFISDDWKKLEDTYKNDYIVMKYPVKKGEDWAYKEDGGRMILQKIVNILPTYSIKGQEYYEVLKIKYSIIDGKDVRTTFRYYAINIGLIAEEMEDGTLFKYITSFQ